MLKSSAYHLLHPCFLKFNNVRMLNSRNQSHLHIQIPKICIKTSINQMHNYKIHSKSTQIAYLNWSKRKLKIHQSWTTTSWWADLLQRSVCRARRIFLSTYLYIHERSICKTQGLYYQIHHTLVNIKNHRINLNFKIHIMLL